MYRKHNGTEEYIKISPANGKGFFDTQKIHTGYSQPNAQPHQLSHFLMKKKTQHRDNDNVQGGNKSRFCYRRILYPLLLQQTGRT